MTHPPLKDKRKEMDKLRNEIILGALSLAKAYHKWQIGKGSMRSFGINKGNFWKLLTSNLNAIILLSRKDSLCN